MEKQLKVGVGILIFKDGKILLGKRKGSHGAGEYSSPGGSMEFGESIIDCAKREAKEEANIEIDNVQFMFLSNLRSYPGKHFVHIQLRADWKSGIPTVMEKEKCEGWDWYSLDNLPQPMFGTFLTIQRHLKTGEIFIDE